MAETIIVVVIGMLCLADYIKGKQENVMQNINGLRSKLEDIQDELFKIKEVFNIDEQFSKIVLDRKKGEE